MMATLARLAGHIGYFGQIDQIWHHFALGEILEVKKLKKNFLKKKFCWPDCSDWWTFCRHWWTLCPNGPNGPNLALKSNFLMQNDYLII